MNVPDTIAAHYLSLGKDGAGEEYTVNNSPRYAFELTPEDFAAFPELETLSEGKLCLLVGDGFAEFADEYEDKDESDSEESESDEEEEEENPRVTAVATLKMLRYSVQEAEFLELISDLQKKFNYDPEITLGEFN